MFCLFTFAIAADLLGNGRSIVSVSRWSSRRRSDLGTVLDVVGGFHPANLAKRTLTSQGLVPGGGGGGQSEICVDHCRNILPGLLAKLLQMTQRLLAGYAGLVWHPFNVILIKDMLLDQGQVSVTDRTELRPIKLSGTYPANGFHYVRMTFLILGHDDNNNFN